MSRCEPGTGWALSGWLHDMSTPQSWLLPFDTAHAHLPPLPISCWPWLMPLKEIEAMRWELPSLSPHHQTHGFCICIHILLPSCSPGELLLFPSIAQNTLPSSHCKDLDPEIMPSFRIIKFSLSTGSLPSACKQDLLCLFIKYKVLPCIPPVSLQLWPCFSSRPTQQRRCQPLSLSQASHSWSSTSATRRLTGVGVWAQEEEGSGLFDDACCTFIVYFK